MMTFIFSSLAIEIVNWVCKFSFLSLSGFLMGHILGHVENLPVQWRNYCKFSVPLKVLSILIYIIVKSGLDPGLTFPA